MPNRASFDDEINLHVYKASAGSGKTHKLTEEYLLLLFASPMAYRNILAVTFTNKATDEMKSRIIAELAKLAKNEPSSYIESLSNEYGMNEMQVRKEGRDVLVRILHDYSSFSVSTIDRFFQQTMRAFTREIGLGGGYNVELDTERVLTESIDNLLYDLERTDNKMLLDWLIRFSEEKVENGETWNIRNDIQSLSSEIFKESFKAYSTKVQENIEDKALMTSYKDMLHKMIAIFENMSQQIGEKGLNIMDRYNLIPDDFKGGSRSPFLSFIRWANGEIAEPTKTFASLVDSQNDWYTSKTPSDVKAKIDDAYPELNQCVGEIVHHYNHSRSYQTAKEINRYFFTLGILGDVDKQIRAYATENNIMLISDTTELLNRIIDGNDSPFIYEKVGMRINNYMIDEFQDTSGMQWQNFKPLVQDSLAAGNTNFIVGDVKQSIYRWRNSDWKLLDSQLDKDFGEDRIDHQTLDTNWRSAYNVVNFNNAIFTIGAQLLQDTYNSSLPENSYAQEYVSRIEDAYSELFQKVATRNKEDAGHVKVQFIDEKEHGNWTEYVLENLPHQIEDLQDRGYRLQDIAILVRTKKEGADIANRLLEYKGQATDSKYKYDIISDEALYVSNAKVIRLIIALLKHLRSPNDMTLRSLAICEYFKYNDQLESTNALSKLFSENESLPEEIDKKLGGIREFALYEMIETLFELFLNQDDNEQIYMQAFLDMVLDFTIKKSSDLDSFLNWWDEMGTKRTIYTPDGQDAISIMTIHKSKGLEFKAVIIPFCDWGIDHRAGRVTLWCNPKMEPFDQLHLVPVNYSSRLINTIFENEYYEERLHAFIDNINVLYVAFTRAESELLVFAPLPVRKDVNAIPSFLWNCINNSHHKEELINLEENYDEEESLFELGAGYQHIQKTEKKKGGIEVEINSLPSISFDDRLKLQLNNKYFFTDTGLRDYGTLMHEIVSSIDTKEDIAKAVERYYISGDITQDQKLEVSEMLHRFLEKDIVNDWYMGDYKVLNEVQILQAGGKFVRPDRVMIRGSKAIVIDYKFGEKEDKRYIKQVKNYVNQIEKIGYEDVSGFICYVRLDKIVEVSYS